MLPVLRSPIPIALEGMPLSANANALGEGIQIMYVFKSFHKRYYFSPDPVSYPGGPVFFIALAEKRK